MRSQKERSKPAPPANLWEQMDAIMGAPLQDDEGHTLEELAQRYRVTVQNAGVKARRLVREGKLIQGRRKGPNGHFLTVYRPA